MDQAMSWFSQLSLLPERGFPSRWVALAVLVVGGMTLPATGASVSAGPASSFQMGEGNELVVTGGVVVREVAGGKEGAMPMLAIGSVSGHHFLYDPNRPSMQGVWSGQFGRIEADGKLTPFATGLKPFALNRVPWTFGTSLRECQREWHGHEIRDGKIVLRYRISEKQGGMSWEVEETPEFVSEELQRIHFNLLPSAETTQSLNYWLQQTAFRRVSTNGVQNQRDQVKTLLPNQKQFTISFYRRTQNAVVPHGYTIESLDIPTPERPGLFEPTSFDFARDGSVYVSTRTGGVWHRKDGKWSLFADGLEEVNGVQIAPDGAGVYVMQKPELTLLRDTDNDGRADVYETVEDRFRFTGQYHEFAYGPTMNSKGELYFSLGLSSGGNHMATTSNPNQMTSALGYRGWVMKRTPDGQLIPFASGLRSPAGIGMNDKDELFITDNQGDWVASSYLGHVEEGDFLGHPASTWDLPEHGLTPAVLDYRTRATVPAKVPPLDVERLGKIRKHPAVWLAHGELTNSPGHPSFAPETGFGPFAGQAFIADITHRDVVRVALEKVGGKYQGAVFPFIRPLRSAAYATRFDPQGDLWVGSVGRGWVSGAPAIEVIRYQPGSLPFEMHRIELTKEGFDVHFTEPLGSGTVAADRIAVTEFQYQYWDTYGSERFHEAGVPVGQVTVSPDRKTLSMKLPLKADFIYELKFEGLTSQSGRSLENNFAFYTLNQLLP